MLAVASQFLALFAPSPVWATGGGCGTTALGNYAWTASGDAACPAPNTSCPNNCLGATGFRCYAATSAGNSVVKINPSCDPTDPTAAGCGVEVHAHVTIPGLHKMILEDGLGGSLTPLIHWYPCSDAACGEDTICGVLGSNQIDADNVDTWVQMGSLTCSTARTLNLSIKVEVCPPSSSGCRQFTTIELPSVFIASQLGCPVPPPDDCNHGGGGSPGVGSLRADAAGAAGQSCPNCKKGGGGVPPDGDPNCFISLDGRVSCAPASGGPGAVLRYLTGGPGLAGLPGSSGANWWQTTLGKFWTHDHAERIVVDPDVSHVWLITNTGSFREFKGLASGTGLRAYDPTKNSPSDEYRKLFYDTPTGGWQLKGLDGSIEYFRSDGLWTQTTLPTDTAHPIQGTYIGAQLTSVGFPDGRSETYGYYTSGPSTGKLNTITENGVGGSPTRTWIYAWSGDHLQNIQRPDGTKWEFTYGTNGAPPDFLSQVRLIGTDGTTGRVVDAFGYDAAGRVQDNWRGDPLLSGPNAVDKQSFSYTGSPQVTQTVFTQMVSGTFSSVTTYNLGRDSVSSKGKVLSMSGPCPSCGLTPNTTWEFNNPGSANPLKPSAMVDGRGIRTEYTYDGNGRMLTRTEAKGVTGQQRTTTWIYDVNFPGLVKEVDQPSTSGGSNLRKTVIALDATRGVMTSRTISGLEAGAAFSYPTGYTYNGAGKPLTIDPPGYTTQDVTSFTYNVAGTNGYLPDTRTDPLVGTTGFGYDGYNRRTAVTDPNGVQTATTYDDLNRVIEVRQKGATAAEDLVTTYLYDCPAGSPPGICNPFRDLRCVQLPNGNGMESLYDVVGRLTEVRRKADCNPATQALERTIYTLDGAGNRTLEDRQHWDAATSAWVSDSKTEYVYSCHLDKTTLGKGSANESVTEYCYDLDDNLAKVWDANHPSSNQTAPASTLYAYDSLNRLSSVTQPWVGAGGGNAVTNYGYDVQDHLATVTDAEGNVTTYTQSDRDLMTREVSPVSGTTNYQYNEHGQLVSKTDARSVVFTYQVDAGDRVTLFDSTDNTLDTTYTYDDPLVPFSKGRLTRISRNGGTIDYRYDRFGRTTQDGGLTYQYDKNGNRTQIGYPDGAVATYTYDFADRQATLQFAGINPLQTIVSSASYKPSGPLASLSLGNGLQETRSFDARYFPSRIIVPGLLDWNYTTDKVGNPTAITNALDASDSRTYGYQDFHYFLTQGNGPWGNQSWTYDRIGNRLTESDSTAPQISLYSYQLNGTGGHTPILTTIDPSAIGSRLAYHFDAAGNETSVTATSSEGGLRNILSTYSAESKLAQLQTDYSSTSTAVRYDGRGLLRDSNQTHTGSTDFEKTMPVYSSDGLLYSRSSQEQTTHGGGGDSGFINVVSRQRTTDILYFAGRPVAQFTTYTDGSPGLLYLTTDHLGAPVLATTTSGTSSWQGGFQPFGSPYRFEEGVDLFLRFSGQWSDPTFSAYIFRGGLGYNVNRWYEPQTGRYSQPDPIGLAGGINGYSYASDDPLLHSDPLGLAATVPGNAIYYVCCKNGKRTICRGPAPLPSDPFVQDCAKEHENDHLNDFAAGRFPCSQCNKHTPNGEPVTTPDKGPVECSGFCVELRCLRKKAKSPSALTRIQYVVDQVKKYCTNGEADCNP